jgi:hypothetical protein
LKLTPKLIEAERTPSPGDAQSFAHVEIKPGDATWRAAFEDEDLDAVVPGAGAPASK